MTGLFSYWMLRVFNCARKMSESSMYKIFQIIRLIRFFLENSDRIPEIQIQHILFHRSRDTEHQTWPRLSRVILFSRFFVVSKNYFFLSSSRWRWLWLIFVICLLNIFFSLFLSYPPTEHPEHTAESPFFTTTTPKKVRWRCFFLLLWQFSALQ